MENSEYGFSLDNNKYQAFISYRHKPLDMAAAKAIHTRLENFRIPARIRKQSGMKKVGRCFRDQDELPTSSDLAQSILDALENSNWLIVVCTPDLPKSKWCMSEIEKFIELHGLSKVLAVLAAGEPHESFPEIIRFETMPDGTVVEREPLAADIRPDSAAGTYGSYSTTGMKKKLRIEKFRLLAPILGVSFDDLRRRARERFLFIAAAAGLSAFLILGGFLAYAINQNYLLEEQRNIAVSNEAQARLERDNALIGQSKFLASLSKTALDEGDASLATLLAQKALPKDFHNPDRPFVADAEVALRNASISMLPFYNTAIRPVAVLEALNIQNTIAAHRLYEDVFVAVTDGKIYMWDAKSGEAYPQADIPYVSGVSYYLDKQSPVLRINYGIAVEVYELQKNRTSIIKSRKTIPLYGESSSDIISIAEKNPLGAKISTKIVSSPDEKSFLYYYWDSKESPSKYNTYISDEATGAVKELPQLSVHIEDARMSGSRIAAVINKYSDKEGIFVFDTITGEMLSELKTREHDIFFMKGMEFSSAGNRILVNTQGAIDIYNAQNGDFITALKADNPEGDSEKKYINAVLFSDDETKIAVLSASNLINTDGELRVYGADSGEEMYCLNGSDYRIRSMVWRGETLLCCNDRGTLILIDPTIQSDYYGSMRRSILAELQVSRNIRVEAALAAESNTGPPNLEIVDFEDGETGIAVIANGGAQLFRTDNALMMPRAVLSGGRLLSGSATRYSPSNTGRYIAFCDMRYLYLFNAQTGEKIRQVDITESDYISSASTIETFQWLDDDRKLLILKYSSGSAAILVEYDIEADKLTWLNAIPFDVYFRGNYSIYGNWGAVYDKEQKAVLISDWMTGETLRMITVPENMPNFCIQPDGWLFASYGYKNDCRDISIFNALTGENVLSITILQNTSVGNVIISPDGKYLTAMLENSTVSIWDIESGALFSSFDLKLSTVTAMWSSNSQYMAFLGGNKVCIYSVLEQGVVSVSSFDINSTMYREFSPDGSMFSAGHVIYDTKSGKQKVVFSIEEKQINPRIVWAGNDRVITRYANDTPAVWLIPPLETVIRIAGESIAGRELTEEERRKFFID